ncbi:uncharacterized protein BJ171DRAFT_457391, partial [Polychytrium aggregatum]|uniref:uncharacterized protein n=1 Tax=Polychytrium aggregatum TaxID=110093 RepID=UPI0022FE0C3E
PPHACGLSRLLLDSASACLCPSVTPSGRLSAVSLFYRLLAVFVRICPLSAAASAPRLSSPTNQRLPFVDIDPRPSAFKASSPAFATIKPHTSICHIIASLSRATIPSEQDPLS